MSFLIRGTLVSSGSFFGIYAVLSLALAGGWRAFGRGAGRLGAGMLYALRISPLSLALVTIVLFVVPSFLCLEPYGTGESVGLVGMALACGGIAVVMFGSISAFAAWNGTRRFVSACSQTRRVRVDRSTAIEMAAPGPMLLVAGVGRPTLLISTQVGEVLDEREMRAAIRHELAHVQSRDNLKKLLLRACRFPGLGSLEHVWAQEAEIAADDTAATDEATALDLASALVKMSRRGPATPVPAVAMSLVPDRDALSARVNRLLQWRPARRRSCWRVVTPVAIALAALTIAGYGAILANVHEVTELLVR